MPGSLPITPGLGHPPSSMAPIRSLVAIPVRRVSSVAVGIRVPEIDREGAFIKVMLVIIWLTIFFDSHRESESMVHLRRPSLHYRGICHGGGHDTRSRFSVLRPRTEEIRAQHDLGLYGQFLDHHVPVVLLGLFVGFFGSGKKWIHWRSQPFWPHQHAWGAKSGVSFNP